MVNEYEDIIQPPEQFRDAYKPIPPPRIGKCKNVKPKAVPRKSVKQMVKEYEDNSNTRTIPGWIQANPKD